MSVVPNVIITCQNYPKRKVSGLLRGAEYLKNETVLKTAIQPAIMAFIYHYATYTQMCGISERHSASGGMRNLGFYSARSAFRALRRLGLGLG
jgi:hypothetical protein